MQVKHPPYQGDFANLAPVIMPFSRNDSFVGRSEIIEKLRTILSHQPGSSNISQGHHRAALYGLGGVGYVARQISRGFYADKYSERRRLQSSTHGNSTKRRTWLSFGSGQAAPTDLSSPIHKLPANSRSPDSTTLLKKSSIWLETGLSLIHRGGY